MNKKEVRGMLLLFLCAFIWGTAFVAQRYAVDYLKPWMYNGCRFFLGGLTLLPLITFLSVKNKKKHPEKKEDKSSRKLLFISGILIGIVLAVSSYLQQKGIETTSIGKAGFITGFYIVIVPILSFFVFKEKYGINVYLSVVIALVGLYLLSVKENFKIETGDILIFISSFGYSLQILLIDYFTKKVNPIYLSCIQMFSCGIFSVMCGLIFERNSFQDILNCAWPIIYAGVMSSGIAYTLQIVGQKDVNSTIASLIMSLESCISFLCSILILHETISMKEIIGCAVMFLAIIISQLKFKSFKKQNNLDNTIDDVDKIEEKR